MGHRRAGVRRPRRRPDPFGAPRLVLAELGRPHAGRAGFGHRRPADRGRGHRRPAARLADRHVDERPAAQRRPDRDLPVPDPDADDRPARDRPHRGEGGPGGAQVRPRGAPAARRIGGRSGSSGSTTSRTTGPSPTSSAGCPRTPRRCSPPPSPAPPATWTRSPPAPASATSAWCGTSARASAGASSAAVDPDRVRRRRARRPGPAGRRGARDRPPARLRGGALPAGRGRSRGRGPRSSCWPRRRPVAHRVAVDLPGDVRDALGRDRLRPARVGGVPDRRDLAAPWDDLYAIACPKRSFAIALNQASIVRGTESVRQPGGSIMTFSPADLGRALLDKSDDEIVEHPPGRPGAGARLRASPTAWSRARRPAGRRVPPTASRAGRSCSRRCCAVPSRVFLAGDYLGTLYTESAITTGFAAAQEAVSLLATDRQRTPPDHRRHHQPRLTTTDSPVNPSKEIMTSIAQRRPGRPGHAVRRRLVRRCAPAAGAGRSHDRRRRPRRRRLRFDRRVQRPHLGRAAAGGRDRRRPDRRPGAGDRPDRVDQHRRGGRALPARAEPSGRP